MRGGEVGDAGSRYGRAQDPEPSPVLDQDHGAVERPRRSRRFHWFAPARRAPTWAHGWCGACGDPALIAGADSTAITARTDRTIRDVLANGHLNGWSPYFSIGHDAFLINPPGFTVIIAMIRAATFGQLSTAGAIKVAVLLSFVLLPFAVAACARGRSEPTGGSPRSSGILSVTVSVFAGFGVRGVFETGLYPFQVAAPLFFFALAAIVTPPAGRRGAARRSRALWIAALVMTHILMATVLVYCAAVALARHVPQPATRPLASSRAARWWAPVVGAAGVVCGVVVCRSWRTARWRAAPRRGSRRPFTSRSRTCSKAGVLYDEALARLSSSDGCSS